MLNFLLSILLALNMQAKMENNSQIKTEETKEIEQTVQDSINISSHNHFHFDRDYSPIDIFDFMVDKEITIATMEGYEMPEIVSDPFLKMIQTIKKDSLFKEELKKNYEIGFIDNFVLKITNKEKEKSIYILNSKEIGTKENAHVQYIGYSGETRYGKPLEQVIEDGLEAGAIVTVCHPFACEEKIYKFWSDDRFINEERIRLLERVAEKYQNKICFEEFSAFLGQFLFFSMKDASRRATVFLDELEEKGINVTRTYANDSHVKSKKLIEDMARVYIKMSRSEIDTLDGLSMRESIKKNLCEGKYSLTEKQHTSGWNIYLGFGPDKIRSYWNSFINIFRKKSKRLGEK